VESAKVYSFKIYISDVSMLQNGENGKMWVKTSIKTSVITVPIVSAQAKNMS
jgi:hypothetical protein